MERAALARRRSPSRVVVAAVLLATVVVALLAAWFVAGWREVRARAHEVATHPAMAATRRAGELAGDLRGQLERLVAREGERPYFHYQNLFHDPQASPGSGVTPSPLARPPESPLVLGYFQIEGDGRVTTPTINDEVPSLSDRTHPVQDRAFRSDVARELAGLLRTSPAPRVASKAPQPGPEPQMQQAPPQVVEIDPGTYMQNAAPNAVYRQTAIPSWQGRGTVAVVVSALAWKTLAFRGAPALVAVRDVETPGGTLVQGFVLDRAAVTGWLATHAAPMVARLVAGDGADEVAPGWQIAVAPSTSETAAAATEAHALVRGFALRFAVIGLFAVLVAAAVVWLVARAERLARERSQFAAAAAHELRTPLAGLQLYGDMLADGLGDPDKLHDYARRMSEEAARLGRVVSNVLGFSQLERGNLSVDARPGALGEALRELAERAEPALDRAGAALELDVAPELRARFDRDALARVVGNLLDNAEKYGRGAADRTIRLAARELGDTVEIAVEDRGTGVADARVLFRPFERGAGPDGPAGLGLGLALSRSLARAMGGELSYRARDGGGATFVLALPRA